MGKAPALIDRSKPIFDAPQGLAMANRLANVFDIITGDSFPGFKWNIRPRYYDSYDVDFSVRLYGGGWRGEYDPKENISRPAYYALLRTLYSVGVVDDISSDANVITICPTEMGDAMRPDIGNISSRLVGDRELLFRAEETEKEIAFLEANADALRDDLRYRMTNTSSSVKIEFRAAISEDGMFSRLARNRTGLRKLAQRVFGLDK